MRRVHLLLAAALVFTLVSCSSLSQMMHSGAEAPMWYPDGRNIRGTVCFVAYGSGGSPLVSRDAAYNDLLDRISEYLGYDVAGRYYRELSSNQSIAELSLEIDSTFTSTSMDGVHYHYIMAYAEQPVIDSMRSRQRVVQARMEDEVDRLVESSLQYYRDNNDVEAINELLKAVTISSTYGIDGEGRSPQDLLEKAMGYLENIEIRLSAEHPERAEVTVRVVRDRGLLSPSVVNAPVEATFTVHTHDDRFGTFSVPFVTGQDGRFTFEEYYPLMTQSGTVYFSLDIEDGIDAVARVTGEGFVEEMRALASGVRASFDYSIDTPIAGMSVLLIMDEYGEDGQILDTTWARDAFADYFRDEGILVDVASFPLLFIQGGDRRQESLRLDMVRLYSLEQDFDFVAVHDGARPYVDEGLIIRTLAAATVTGGAVPALRITDAVKKLGKDGLISENIDRSPLITVQTPQIFRRNELLDAYDRFPGLEADDDAAVFISAGYSCTVSRGSAENTKITFLSDIPDAEKQAEEYVRARDEGRKSAAASRRMRELLQQGDDPE